MLQNSFFAHFSLWGATPNLVFIFFLLLLFFEKNSRYYEMIFYAISAGLLLDIFSYTYFGLSAVLFLLIGFLAKRVQGALSEKKDNTFPIIYFLPLFLIFLLVYDLLSRSFLNKFNLMKIAPNMSGFAAEIIYNLLVAAIAFYVCKKFLKFGIDDRQLPLFKK
jgi:rod shape-determining protein MreD